MHAPAIVISRRGRLAWRGAFLALSLVAAVPAWAQTAGKFLVSIGDVKLVGKDGVTRLAERGGELREGDIIVTGANGLAQIRLQDNGLLSVRPSTEMKLDKFAYAGQDDGKASLLISLAKGGLRSITGLIGKANRDGYRISTATATIGIRGTDHEPFYIPPGQGALGAPGTYDKVNAGMTVIRGRQGNPLEVAINQVAFVPPSGAAPVILPSVPPFYKQDLPVPDPQARKGGAPAPDTASDQRERRDDKIRATGAVDRVRDVTVKGSTDPLTKAGTLDATVLSPIDSRISTTTTTDTKVLSTVTTTPIATTTLQVAPTTTTTLQTAPLTTTTVQPLTTTVTTPLTTTVTAPVTTTVQPLTTPITTTTTPLLQTAPLLR